MTVLQELYECHLRKERGLADQSVQSYRPFIKEFLVERVAMTGSACAAALAPQDVRDFLLDRIRERPTKSSKLLSTALRSFLRFMFLRGETAVDLSLVVPTVRQWRQATVHTFISSGGGRAGSASL